MRVVTKPLSSPVLGKILPFLPGFGGISVVVVGFGLTVVVVVVGSGLAVVVGSTVVVVATVVVGSTVVVVDEVVVGGNVIAKYVDTAGNTISNDVVKSGNVGENYTTDQKTIPGYSFKEIQGPASGQFTSQEQTVTYVYTKDRVVG